MRNIRLTKNGIECRNSMSTVYLDPKKIQSSGVNFVSHAHIDHLPNGGNGTILSSGADITPNADCGIYDATYDTDAEGTYHVNISAIADGIQTGFETTFDVANYVEFDIIRTAQSKIDALKSANIAVAPSPAKMGETMLSEMQKRYN